jgi:hypothetical protein
MSPDVPHLSDLRLDAHRLGPLTSDSAAEVSDHLEACPRCAARLSELEEADAAFRERFSVPGLVAETLSAGQATRPTRPSALPAWWAGGAAALALGALLVLNQGSPAPPHGIEINRIKGGAGLMAHVRSGATVRPVQDGELLQPGDALMLRMRPAVPGFAMVVGVEPDGTVNLIHPASGQWSAPAPDPAAWSPSERSYVLDDSSGYERLFALYSDAPLELSAVREAAGRAGDVRKAKTLPVSGAKHQATLLVLKP